MRANSSRYGPKGRSLPLPPELYARLEAIKGTTFLWESYPAGIKEAVEKMGMPIPYRDADGLVADFHAATRHSYVSLLARSGVHPKLAQELARHSDIRLTMQTYTHTRLHDLAGAVEGLPPLLPTSTGTDSAKQVLRATGTDSVGAPVGRGWVQFGDAGCAPMMADDGTSPSKAMQASGCKSLSLMQDEGECGSLMHAEEKLPGLDSNQDKESQNLLCYRYTTG